MKIAIIGVVALALTGCSVIMPKAGPQLAKGINKYCSTASEQERLIIREQVNEAIQPNQICVRCEGDAGQQCLAQ